MQSILIDAILKTISLHELPDLGLRHRVDPDGKANWEGIKSTRVATFVLPNGERIEQ